MYQATKTKNIQNNKLSKYYLNNMRLQICYYIHKNKK